MTENVGGAAAAPPAGFEAIEPNSYTVALAVSKGAGLTLSKIDYIFDAAAAGLVGKDATKAQVGRLCTETNSFVISETLGELEFEAEENEVTLNLNKNVTAEGQWGKSLQTHLKPRVTQLTHTTGIFLPVAVAAGEGAAAANGTAEAGKGKGKGNANAGKEKAAKGKAKAGEGMAAADAAKEKAAQQNEALAALLEAAQKEQAASAAKGAHAMRRK